MKHASIILIVFTVVKMLKVIWTWPKCILVHVLWTVKIKLLVLFSDFMTIKHQTEPALTEPIQCGCIWKPPCTLISSNA